MSDHLPECTYEPEHWDVEQGILWGNKPCICDRLRACAQNNFAAGWADGNRCALDAAISVLWQIEHRYEAHTDAMPYDGASLIFTRDAVFAIDALRGEV